MEEMDEMDEVEEAKDEVELLTAAGVFVKLKDANGLLLVVIDTVANGLTGIDEDAPLLLLLLLLLLG